MYRQTITHIAQNMAVSASIVHRKLKQLTFNEDFSCLLKCSPATNFSIKRVNWPLSPRILRQRKLLLALITGVKLQFEITFSNILKRLRAAWKSSLWTGLILIFPWLKSYFQILKSFLNVFILSNIWFVPQSNPYPAQLTLQNCSSHPCSLPNIRH